MNIQTERLENHTARFTVTLEPQRLEQAKQTAARNLSKRVNIPGFRKGKVPYRVLLQFLGEGAILEDALEILGNEVYKQALDQSEVQPYGPGELEDFQVDPEPTFKFVVPLQPTVDLGDYRSVRLEFSEPMVEDDQVNRSMRQLQEQHAVIEESQQPVAIGNRVTVEMYAKLIGEDAIEGEKAEEGKPEGEHEHSHDHDDDHEHAHDHGLGGNEFIHEHNTVLVLGEENEEPAPGFRDALVGAAANEERVFELTYPDDEKEYQEFAGKRAQFKVSVKKIETMTLPAMNDDFAARVTEKEEKPLTLLELRMRMRENLQKSVEQRAKSDFAGQVLDELVNKATINFPEALIDDQSEEYLERLDRDLRRQGLTLDDYIRISGKERDAIKTDYHDVAVQNIKRSLVLREIMSAEKIDVTESSIVEQIDKMLGQFGDQAESLRSALDTPAMRENIKNDLMEQGVLDRIVAIAKGEAPALSEEAATTSSEVTEQGEAE
ncbi:MAG: trigger factor [Anaerolineae bacterium]|nr:trigger factor [Anaerolineae bacterium]